MLLKLIIQHPYEGKVWGEVFKEMDNRVRCRQRRMSVLNSMLVSDSGRRDDSQRSNNNSVVMQKLVEEVAQL